MIRLLLLIFFIVLHVHVSVAQETNRPSVPIIPYPSTVMEGEGTFVFTQKTTIAFEGKEMEPMVKAITNEQIDLATQKVKNKGAKKYIAYFQSFTATYLPAEVFLFQTIRLKYLNFSQLENI